MITIHMYRNDIPSVAPRQHKRQERNRDLDTEKKKLKVDKTHIIRVRGHPPRGF